MRNVLDLRVARAMLCFARYRALKARYRVAHGSSRAEVSAGAIRMDGRPPGRHNPRSLSRPTSAVAGRTGRPRRMAPTERRGHPQPLAEAR